MIRGDSEKTSDPLCAQNVPGGVADILDDRHVATCK